MTLKEMSAQYEEAAQPIRERLRELRGQLAQTNDQEEIWCLKRRIAELTPMLRQMNELAWMLEHYYERGDAVRDDRYGFNGIRKGCDKRTAKRNPGGYYPGGIDRMSATDIPGLLLSGAEHNPDSGHSRGKQEHCLPDLKTSRRKNSTDHKASLDFDDALLDSLFGSSPKK